jgi:flagellar basal body-associated protein FliL
VYRQDGSKAPAAPNSFQSERPPIPGASDKDEKRKSYGVFVVVVVVIVVVVSVVVVAAGVPVMVVAVMVVDVSSTTAGASVVEVSVVVVVSFLVQPVRSTVPKTAAKTRVRNFFISLSFSLLANFFLRNRLETTREKRAHDISTRRPVKRETPSCPRVAAFRPGRYPSALSPEAACSNHWEIESRESSRS